MKAGRPPFWSVAWRMSGVLGQRFGTEEIGDRRLGDLFKVFLQLVAGIAPGEVGVGLSEAGLGE